MMMQVYIKYMLPSKFDFFHLVISLCNCPYYSCVVFPRFLCPLRHRSRDIVSPNYVEKSGHTGLAYTRNTTLCTLRSPIHWRLILTTMVFNATASQSYYELAYAGTDFDSLNWLEQQWVAWYIWI